VLNIIIQYANIAAKIFAPSLNATYHSYTQFAIWSVYSVLLELETVLFAIKFD